MARRLVALMVLGLTAPVARQGLAQGGIRPSQRGTVSQRVGYTDISLTYNRPVARGRTLFPDVVNWGRTWTPGADSATLIEFSRDVEVEGQALRAGTYSLWMVPQPAPQPWTVIFSKAVHIFHLPYPGPDQDALRVSVTPTTGEHMEVLAFYFPVVAADSAVLRMHWGATMVPLTVRVHNR